MPTSEASAVALREAMAVLTLAVELQEESVSDGDVDRVGDDFMELLQSTQTSHLRIVVALANIAGQLLGEVADANEVTKEEALREYALSLLPLMQGDVDGDE